MYDLTVTAEKKISLPKFLKEMGFLVFSAVLFALSFPNILNEWGFFPVTFFCLTPIFIVIHNSGWIKTVFYGIFYGYICYVLFNYWLASFAALSIVIVPVIYAAYFLILFPFLKLADTLFPKWGFIVQAGVWLAYEYLRTLGFLGYPYGNLGYSQYLFRPFIQISSITGVWFISLMVVLSSTFIGNGLVNGYSSFKAFVRERKIFVYIYSAVFIGMLIFGFFSPSDFSDSAHVRLGFVQHSADSRKGGFKTFERNMHKMIDLSKEALKEDSGIEMMIWSETCFVPGIDWYTRNRTDADMYRLVKELKDFFHTQNIPYVIGNDDGQLEPNEDGELERVEYNAVLLYEGTLKETYRKTHLVPFSKNFPYKKQMPRFYQALKDREYHWWKKGTEYTVFDAAGIKFSTPICFEDILGYHSREFVRNGAQLIVNLTNDSWSGSIPAEMQHMAMAVFSAVENRRTVVRGTNSGITCSIEPDGQITNIIKPFEPNYMIASVPIFDEGSTFYTAWGDWFAVMVIILTMAAMLIGAVMKIRRIALQK